MLINLQFYMGSGISCHSFFNHGGFTQFVLETISPDNRIVTQIIRWGWRAPLSQLLETPG